MTGSTVVFLPSAEGVEDPLTGILRAGARELVRHAVEAEVAALLAAYEDHRTESGRRRVVRHGHGPERTILTGIGPARCVGRRFGIGVARERIVSGSLRGSCRGQSSRWGLARRRRSLDAALPTLYLLGVSSGTSRKPCRNSWVVGPRGCRRA